MLPRVKIVFENGRIGGVGPITDSVVGLVVTATAVASKFELTKPYILRSLGDLKKLGISQESGDANAFAYKTVREYYDVAGDGSILWLMGVPNSVKQSEIVDKNNELYAYRLIKASGGHLNCIMVAVNPASSYVPVIENGLDKDLQKAMANAQSLAEWSTSSLFAPVFFLLEARHYEGDVSALPDLTTYEYNRVGVIIGDTVKNSKGASVGLLGGRIASIPVQRHIGRVKDGALRALELYIGEDKASWADIHTINDKGFITFRTFVGKSGYYFSNDALATNVVDDYHSIARRRVIDKAYRIAYRTLLQELNDEVPVTDEGKLVPAMAKGWQSLVETAIINEMTSEGNLGIDPTSDDDNGVQCYIDYNQNIVSTGKIDVVLRVKPYGYAQYIDVKLGFNTTKII